MAEQFSVDFGWVRKKEGGSLRTPYVPVCDAKSIKNSKNLSCFSKPLDSVIGKSGVTVATGFDIGQHNEYDIRSRYRFPKAVVDKMKPFLGLKGEAAKKALRDNPGVKFDASDVQVIDATIKNFYLKLIAKQYKKDSGKEFSSLHPNVQTSVFSAVYNYGDSSIKPKGALRDFWGLVIQDKMAEAAVVLAKKKSNNSRRQSEAELIKGAVGVVTR